MLEEFKQSLQLTNEEIFERVNKQCRNNKPEKVKELIEYFNITKDKISKNCIVAIQIASIENCPKITTLLLNYGVKLNQCTEALGHASANNNIDIVTIFLNCGINPEQCTAALLQACINSNTKIISLFINYGISIEQCTEALEFAKDYNNKETLILLENHINKVNSKQNKINKDIREQKILKQLSMLAKQLKHHSIIVTENN